MSQLLVDANDQAKVLKHLTAHNFLNETRFAESYTSGKVAIKKWGRLKIKQGLLAKKIDPALIKVALESIDEDVYRRNLASLIEQKSQLVKAPNEYTKKAKIQSYLVQKGYEFDLIHDMI